MVKEWKELMVGDVGTGGGSAVILLFWGVLVTLFVISAIIFSCAEGASKDKGSTVYGGGCDAGCGAACGA